MMTTESSAAPDVAANTATSEPVVTPEVTTPEIGATSTPETDARPDDGNDADKSLRRMQRRVDRVTAARYQAEARAQQLEEQLARYQQQAQPEEGERQSIDPARMDEIVSQKAREIARVEQVAERSNKAFESGVKSFGEAFKASVAAVIDEAGPLIDPKGLPTSLGEAILDSDEPAKLLHYLGQNPDAAESLRGLTAAQLGRRIERIEASMKQPGTTPSKAPKPLEPIKGRGEVSKDPTEMSDKEFAAWRKAQIAKRR